MNTYIFGMRNWVVQIIKYFNSLKLKNIIVKPILIFRAKGKNYWFYNVLFYVYTQKL